ncbi:MAG: hypothetical protein INQ03_03320 [Candidatus Heimdallarchaeota archaeon]|nr:hypothetical protein [Candidatus Heimdallarchaeota archaeon]
MAYIDWSASNYYGYAFIFSIMASIAVGFIFYKVWKKRRTHNAMVKLTNPYVMMLLAMLSVPIILAAGTLDQFIADWKDINERGVFFIGLTNYFIYWILGTNLFLKSIIRLPEDRKKQFNRLQKLIAFVIAMDVIYAILSWILISIDLGDYNVTNLLELGFAISALIGLFVFLYYYRSLKQEINKNASKLIKARIAMLSNAVFTQILFVLVIFIGTTILAFDIKIIEDELLESTMFLILNTIAFVSSVVIYQSIDIPNRVRARYNITPKRFNFAVKA